MKLEDKNEIETLLEQEGYVKKTYADKTIKGKNNWYLNTANGYIQIISWNYSYGTWSLNFYSLDLSGSKIIGSSYPTFTIVNKEIALSQLKSLKMKIKVLTKMYKNNIISKRMKEMERDFI